MFFEGFPEPNGAVEVQRFTALATATNVQWMVWRKPQNKQFAFFYVIGGGGGGGGGFTRAAAAAGGGGGGGGSSSQVSLLMPMYMLPDVLYIQVGGGGAGVGSGGGTAGSGVASYVCIAPNSTVSNTLVVSTNTPPTGGGTGTGAAVGAAGAAGSIPTIANMPLAQAGLYLLIAGQAGAAGGAVAGAVGTNTTIATTGVRTQGGAGGAGTTSADFAGGGVTAITDSFLSAYRPAAPAAGSNDGSGGYELFKPMWFWAGLGGSSSNAGVGGQGGNGAYGSGGGGGGAGTTGGTGGRGGNGIVIITAW